MSWSIFGGQPKPVDPIYKIILEWSSFKPYPDCYGNVEQWGVGVTVLVNPISNVHTVPINVCRWLKLTSRSNLHRRSQVKLRSIEVSSGSRLRSYWGVGCPIGGHNDQWDCSPTTDNMYFPSSTTVPSSQSSLGRIISSDTTLPLSGHAFCPPFYVEPGVAGQHYLYSLLDQGQYG